MRMQEAILSQYPTFDFAEHPVVINSKGTQYYLPQKWPSSGFGTAPTLAQVQTWMAA